MHRGNASAKDVARRAGEVVVGLGYPRVGLVVNAIRERDAELAYALLPRLVASYAGDGGVSYEELHPFVWAKNANPALLLDLVERRRTRLDRVAERCRQQAPK